MLRGLFEIRTSWMRHDNVFKDGDRMKSPRIFLVDDHALVRRGIAALLRADGRYEVIGEAENGEDALGQLADRVADGLPDVVLLDLAMPRLDGLATMRRIQKQWPRLAVVILTMHHDEQFVAQALRAGARGYLLKQSLETELFEALALVLRGERYVTPAIDMTQVPSQHEKEPDLTAREREVLQLVSDGHTTQAVAEILNISHHTATRHRANLMQKLHVHNQMELMRTAISRGLVVAAGRDPTKIG
jgi:DNA-binding NarL/FixJ family response regulator